MPAGACPGGRDWDNGAGRWNGHDVGHQSTRRPDHLLSASLRGRCVSAGHSCWGRAPGARTVLPGNAEGAAHGHRWPGTELPGDRDKCLRPAADVSQRLPAYVVDLGGPGGWSLGKTWYVLNCQPMGAVIAPGLSFTFAMVF